MSQKSSTLAVFEPSNELSQIFGAPALVGSEKIEDYERFFEKVTSAIRPSDVIGYLFIRDITDWSWEIRRERLVKAETIRYFEKEIVGELIKSELAPTDQFDAAEFRVFEASAKLASWVSDPNARTAIDEELAAKGYNASYILAQVYMRGAVQIEAIDRRIAFHELRRSAAMKDEGVWSDRLLRRLDQATPDVIDGEFTEAAEGN